jgi:hypothetical protein
MNTGLLTQAFPPAEQILDRVVRSPLGALAEQPWLDPVGLYALRNWFFPLSRLWAAAALSDGLVTKFLDDAGIARRGSALATAARIALSRSANTRRRLVEATQRWDDALFGDGVGDLAAVDAARVAAGFAHLMSRASFIPVLALAEASPVRWEIPTAEDVAAAHGAALADVDAAFAAPAMPPVTASPAYDVPSGRRRWLRFAAPSSRMTDEAFARVTEPRWAGSRGAGPHDARRAPSIVVANGICIEIDYLDGGVDVAATLAGLGFRVIEMVTPWHGRRAPAGWYGGEPFFGTAPLGPLDLFHAAVREMAVLVGWARSFDAPVAVAGISLGSLVCQLVASRSAAWPVAMRPDAALLIAHSGRLETITFDGALTSGLGLGDAMARAGWTREALYAWLPLLNPAPRLAIDPARVVSVVGLADRIVPARDGQALCDAWRVPAENRFVSNQCHFSVPIHLYRQRAPLERLRQVLA